MKNMVKIDILKHPTNEDWELCKKCTLATIAKSPKTPVTHEWKVKLLKSNHSPVRTLQFCFRLDGIPYWVSTQLARHVHATPFISTQRNDRQKSKDRNLSRQDEPVLMCWYMNAEELITIARKRLCNQASPETRAIVWEICSKVIEVNPEFEELLVPLCVYRGGKCDEFFPCGGYKTPLTPIKQDNEIDNVDKIDTKAIMIYGKARSGKDTLAEFLYTHLESKGYRVKIMHFADLLKYICTEFLGWNGLKDDKGRAMLQSVGTDIIRSKNKDFWVDFLANIVTFFHKEWDYVIIPDCRFLNEINFLKEKGVSPITVRVVRPNFTSLLTPKQKSHESETALDSYVPNFTIINDRDLRSLEKNAYKLLETIEGKWL